MPPLTGAGNSLLPDQPSPASSQPATANEVTQPAAGIHVKRCRAAPSKPRTPTQDTLPRTLTLGGPDTRMEWGKLLARVVSHDS